MLDPETYARLSYSGIYAIIDGDTEEVLYIGRSKCLSRRFCEHKWEMLRADVFGMSDDKYRVMNYLHNQHHNLVFHVLEEVGAEDIEERETWYIRTFLPPLNTVDIPEILGSVIERYKKTKSYEKLRQEVKFLWL